MRDNNAVPNVNISFEEYRELNDLAVRVDVLLDMIEKESGNYIAIDNALTILGQKEMLKRRLENADDN